MRQTGHYILIKDITHQDITTIKIYVQQWRGRWERGIGMGNTCNSMADSCQGMTKPTAML